MSSEIYVLNLLAEINAAAYFICLQVCRQAVASAGIQFVRFTLQ